LSPKAIPDLKSALRPIEIRETTNNSEDIALNDYNSNIIVINISRSKNEEGETQELAKYIYTT
jgi:hypothetical protein